MNSKKRDLFRDSYLDKQLKDFYVEHGIEIFGFEVIINPDPYGVDLLVKHDHTIGIELERSSAVYGYWDDPIFNDAIKHGFRTVNMEWNRKGHFFQEYHLKYPEKPAASWNPTVHNESYTKIIFSRCDFFFHQFIIVDNATVRNKDKTLFKPGKVWNNNNPEPEFWASWRYNDVKTINRINEKFLAETTDTSTHLPPISGEERLRLEEERDRIKAEAKKEQARIEAEAEEKEKKRIEALGKKLNIVERREIAKATVPMFENVLNKTLLDNLDIPQYETQKEEYYKKHPVLKK